MTAEEGVAQARGLDPGLGTLGQEAPALQAIKNFFSPALAGK